MGLTLSCLCSIYSFWSSNTISGKAESEILMQKTLAVPQIARHPWALVEASTAAAKPGLNLPQYSMFACSQCNLKLMLATGIFIVRPKLALLILFAFELTKDLVPCLDTLHYSFISNTRMFANLTLS